MMLLYRLVLWLALPAVLMRLLWRSRGEAEYGQRIGERFGLVPAKIKSGVIWFHTVSAGESIAAAPLIRGFMENNPQYEILVTTMTPTGSDQVRQRLGDSVGHCYAPYDFNFAVDRFLKKVRPQILVLMETEIWPNLITRAKSLGIPIVLINARMSERSAKGYRRFRWLSRPLFEIFEHVCCQSEAHLERFLDLGVPPTHASVFGSVKYDLKLPDNLFEQTQRLKVQFNLDGRPVWIAASTHPGEEEQIIQAHLILRAEIPNLCLILVPRHPHRGSEIGRLVEGNKMSWIASSGEAMTGTPDVVVGDVMGQLLALYGLAEVAFVGGSLVPHGGHNPIEPALLALPIVAGPADFNFAEVVATFTAADAYRQVVNAGELALTIAALLSNKTLRSEMGAKALAAVDENRGATERTLALLKRQLEV